MTDVAEIVAEWTEAIAGMERALDNGDDFVSVFHGPPELLPEGVSAMFTIPHGRLAEILPAAREKLVFWQNLAEGFDQLARGERVPAHTREEEASHD